MIGTRERQQGTAGGGRLFTLSEGDVNNLRVQMAEALGAAAADVLSTHTEATRELLEHLRARKARRIKVDYFRSTATQDVPGGTGTKLTFPNGWLPAPAVIASVVFGVGGTAAATLQIGRRIYPINVSASIATPGSLPLSEETGLIVYPEDLVQLSVPTTAVVLSLELIGYVVDPADPDRVVS